MSLAPQCCSQVGSWDESKTTVLNARHLKYTFAIYPTVYNVQYEQCAMYHLQCTMYHGQYTMFNVQCTVYNVQCTIYMIYSVYDALPEGEMGGMVRGHFRSPPPAWWSTQLAGSRPVPPGECWLAQLAEEWDCLSAPVAAARPGPAGDR